MRYTSASWSPNVYQSHLLTSDGRSLSPGHQGPCFHPNRSEELCVPAHAFVAQHGNVLFPGHTGFSFI